MSRHGAPGHRKRIWMVFQSSYTENNVLRCLFHEILLVTIRFLRNSSIGPSKPDGSSLWNHRLPNEQNVGFSRFWLGKCDFFWSSIVGNLYFECQKTRFWMVTGCPYRGISTKTVLDDLSTSQPSSEVDEIPEIPGATGSA